MSESSRRPKIISKIVAMHPIYVLAAFLALLLSISTHESLASDIEQRAQDLFYRLRCVVCDGQVLSESDSAIAEEIRGFVRHKIGEGESDSEIVFFLKERYGDTIVSLGVDAHLEGRGYHLYLAPILIVLMLIGGYILWYRSSYRLSKRKLD